MTYQPKLTVPRFQMKGDGRDWARKILNDPKRYKSAVVKQAKEALGIQS